jgi:glycosyltransferase involved in cell wall biosynthesis
MHVALIHDHVGGKGGGGGGVRLMLELAAGLVQRGHRVTIACHDHLPGSAFDSAQQVEIRSVRRGEAPATVRRGDLTRRYWVDLPKVARLVPADADVVNAQEWPALRPARIASGRLGMPFVWTRNDESLWERAIVPEHTMYGDRRMSRRLLRAAVCWPDLLDARRAAEIVVLSRTQAEMVRRSYRRDATIAGIGPAAQFFHPPDRAAARARLGIADGTFLVVAFGIFVEHRRFEDLVEAMALLRDDPSIEALVMGSDHADRAYADRIEALVGERGLRDRVKLSRGSVSEAELRDTYAAADAFAILSQRYGWGLAPLEAIAAGTPVILTPGAGVVDILAGRPGVQVVPMQDPVATAEAIRRWRSGAGREGIEQTRAWLRDEYSIDRYVERMVEVYERALATAS